MANGGDADDDGGAGGGDDVEGEAGDSDGCDETECDDGYTLTSVYSEITDQNQNRCVKDKTEEIELVEDDEATIYYGNLREKFTIYIVSTENEVISTIIDYDIIKVTNLSVII